MLFCLGSCIKPFPVRTYSRLSYLLTQSNFLTPLPKNLAHHLRASQKGLEHELAGLIIRPEEKPMPFSIIELKQGNLDNNHIYLSSAIDLFPAESIGGPNGADLGAELEIHCGIAERILTDIAGDKKIFRKRAWVGEFFRSHSLVAGSRIIIERTGANRYHIYPVRP